MKYLILTVLLIVVQASPPISRQAPDSSTSANGNSQKQAQSGKAPSKVFPSSINQNRTKTADSNTAKQENAATKQSLVISELPAVTINNRRDWADWGTWFFTFLLAFAGLLQIILLWKTLKITSKQADIAGRQERQMAEAGEQTERIIAQMKETEVRDLRAYVGVSKTLLRFQNPLQPEGMVEIQNFGKTPAYKVRHQAAITIGPHPLAVTLPDIPAAPSASVFTLYSNIKNTNSVTLKKPVLAGTSIGTMEHTVYVFGRVVYEDAFGNEWYTKYRFIFGGPGGGVLYTDQHGLSLGAMYTDSAGNEAI